MRKTDATLLATGAVLTAAILGARHRPSPDQPLNMAWYAALEKPSWRPSGPTIGAAWMALDALLAYAGSRLWTGPATKARLTARLGWTGAVAGIAIYPWTMFGRHKNGEALAVVGAMTASAITGVVGAAKVDRTAAKAMLPLIGWLLFAGALQEEIWRRER